EDESANDREPSPEHDCSFARLCVRNKPVDRKCSAPDRLGAYLNLSFPDNHLNAGNFRFASLVSLPGGMVVTTNCGRNGLEVCGAFAVRCVGDGFGPFRMVEVPFGSVMDLNPARRASPVAQSPSRP